ncbi:MAG: hypothetical protein ACHQRK_11045 [Gemmatimonadales bacterium]
MPWIGFFLPPAAYFVHLQVAYVLVPWACGHDGSSWVHAVGALAVLVAAFGTAIAWRVRARFLGLTGFGMGLLFTLMLLAQLVAGFLIGTCQ